MADRYSDSRDRNQQGSQGDWSRQSEQFESGRNPQQNINSTWNERSNNDRGGSQDRSLGGGRSWREREQGSQGANYDPTSDYDQAGSDYRRRRDARNNADHNYFTGDDFGGGEQTNNYGRKIYGGNAMGGSSYARAGYSQYGAKTGNAERSERGFLDRAGDEVASWFGDDEAARRREQDHRGRGPEGYSRSDQRILEDACDRLTEDRGVDATGITVTVDKGELTLAGTIGDRNQKRRAEDCVEDVSGVKHVQNNLRVATTGVNTAEQTDKTPPAPFI